jgi:hypothetical protein
LGKQFHPLPNIVHNAVADVGLDETSPTYGLGQTTVFNYKIVR